MSNLTELGAERASSPAELAKDVEVVVSMLPSNQHVADVYSIKNGLLRWISSYWVPRASFHFINRIIF